jgi:hypothetical protein
MGWKPLIMALRAAVTRWTAEEMKRLMKEFFDPHEFAYLWGRLSRFTDTKEQLESRLQIQEEGIKLPQGNQKKYVKWLKNTSNASEHAKMMILLQRRQELNIHEWREIRERAYARFGKEEYKKLLQERDESIPEVPKGSIPSFDGKRVIFGAMKEEEAEVTPEWARVFPEVYESLRTGEGYEDALRRVLSATEEEAKMKRIRKNLNKENENWDQMTKVMTKLGCGEGLKWGKDPRCKIGSSRLKMQWEEVWEDIRKRVDAVTLSDSIPEALKLIPEFLAQWDWYMKRSEEAKIPIIEQWKKMDIMRRTIHTAWNYRPDAERIARPSGIDNQVTVEHWYLDEKTGQFNCMYGTLEMNEWKNPKEVAEFAKDRATAGYAHRDSVPDSESICISPLYWFGDAVYHQRTLNGNQLYEWPAIWTGRLSDWKIAADFLEEKYEQHKAEKMRYRMEADKEREKLLEMQLVYRQYDRMTEKLHAALKNLIVG